MLELGNVIWDRWYLGRYYVCQRRRTETGGNSTAKGLPAAFAHLPLPLPLEKCSSQGGLRDQPSSGKRSFFVRLLSGHCSPYPKSILSFLAHWRLRGFSGALVLMAPHQTTEYLLESRIHDPLGLMWSPSLVLRVVIAEKGR